VQAVKKKAFGFDLHGASWQVMLFFLFQIVYNWQRSWHYSSNTAGGSLKTN
jgi:hypothetical protein